MRRIGNVGINNGHGRPQWCRVATICAAARLETPLPTTVTRAGTRQPDCQVEADKTQLRQ